MKFEEDTSHDTADDLPLTTSTMRHHALSIMGLVLSASASQLPRAFAFQPKSLRQRGTNAAAQRIQRNLHLHDNKTSVAFGLPSYTRRSRIEARSSSCSTKLYGSNSDDFETPAWLRKITENPTRSLSFSFLMALCGAALGPFLDSYHSAFGVLKYDEPISAALWGTDAFPALTTAWWVPELFGLAGFLIGWLYILLDVILKSPDQAKSPSPPKILVGISIFTLQYWLTGIMFQSQLDRITILNIMSVVAAAGFLVFDGTMAGFITSAATALGGPLIEVGLLSLSLNGIMTGGYHYNDPGETGFFPLWIAPVYFLGGPAVGNLARGFWNALSTSSGVPKKENQVPCAVCNGTRRVPCPNCDGIGSYVATGGRAVKCTSCRGRGFVMCRACFDRYDEDPYDIDTIRDVMSRMPD